MERRMSRMVVPLVLSIACVFVLPSVADARNFVGTAADECILGTSTVDNLNGMGGRDFVQGFDGPDNVNGGPGNDTVYGGEGNDTVSGGDGNDFSGTALCSAEWGGTVHGGPGEDLMYGNGGDDRLEDKDHDVDVIRGNEGDDQILSQTIVGLSGQDYIYGGPGYDVCFVNSADIVDGCEEVDVY